MTISAGSGHSLALKSDGTVVVWGGRYDDYGLTVLPAGVSNVVAISAGIGHNLVLKSDGTVIAWGRNFEGQTNVPDGLSDVVAISAGLMQSLALKSDGTIVAWGSNFEGETTVPAGLSNVTAISAGYFHGLALSRPETTPTPTPAVPTSKEQCKNGGYRNFIDPSTGQPFKNQGQCIQYVNTGK